MFVCEFFSLGLLCLCKMDIEEKVYMICLQSLLLLLDQRSYTQFSLWTPRYIISKTQTSTDVLSIDCSSPNSGSCPTVLVCYVYHKIPKSGYLIKKIGFLSFHFWRSKSMVPTSAKLFFFFFCQGETATAWNREKQSLQSDREVCVYIFQATQKLSSQNSNKLWGISELSWVSWLAMTNRRLASVWVIGFIITYWSNFEHDGPRANNLVSSTAKLNDRFSSLPSRGIFKSFNWHRYHWVNIWTNLVQSPRIRRDCRTPIIPLTIIITTTITLIS
jgi:hypothetical protein